jgi:LacI family transcriptional regulator
MATIREIAQKTGLSNATVSRVLNYDGTLSVSNATKKLIFQTAEELGYKKKRLSPSIENVVFLYWYESDEELEYNYYKAISCELERQATERNISFQVIQKAQTVNAFPAQCNAFVAIGWFSKMEMDILKAHTLQGVFIDTSPEERTYDSVRPNLDSMVTQMVDYFFEKGHRDIGFAGPADYDMITGKRTMDVREWSFRESAKYYNILREDEIFVAEHITVEAGYQLGLQIFDKLGQRLPTAFCIGSDTLAIGMMQAFHENGVRIPEQTAVFSINNSSAASYVSPPLTTFHIDVPVMCRTALDLLTERVLEHREISKTVYINGKPILRKSC